MDKLVKDKGKKSVDRDSKPQLSMETEHKEKDNTPLEELRYRKTCKELKKRLFLWVSAIRSAGYPVVKSLLREKAIKLNNELGGYSSFKASNRWISRFKKQYGINQPLVQDENNSDNCDATKKFLTNFQAFIATNNYDIENIYNADETLIRWRSIPRASLTLMSKSEHPCSEKEIKKNHLAVLVCANAAGTHSLPLLVVGKKSKPKSMKTILHSLPVNYASTKSGMMTNSIFINWFQEYFVPLVKQRQEENRSKGKVLLILDDAPSHLNVDELNKIDDHVEVIYLPRNVAVVVQPTNQGIIKTMKYGYRKNVLQGIINADPELLSCYKYLKSLDVKTFSCMIADAFASLSPQTLRNGWKKLLPNIEDTCTSDNEKLLAEIKELFYQIPAFADYPEESLQQWLDQDQLDVAFDFPELLDFVSTLEI